MCSKGTRSPSLINSTQVIKHAILRKRKAWITCRHHSCHETISCKGRLQIVPDVPLQTPSPSQWKSSSICNSQPNDPMRSGDAGSPLPRICDRRVAATPMRVHVYWRRCSMLSWIRTKFVWKMVTLRELVTFDFNACPQYCGMDA